MPNRINELFGITYPIIQGGMIWCSGWELASAVSNAGCLGLIGSGSMYPDTLRHHIRKTRDATASPFGVNLPLIYPQVEELVHVIVEEGVKIVFTSAGNPKRFTSFFHDKGITVAHVVSNTRFAVKCQEAGVDAVVAEGFEAGGHDGAEETATMVLTPLVRQVVTLPLITAGGIASGRAMLAAMALGADGVQIGTLFAASLESSAHPSFKQKIIEAHDGDTILTLKKIIPVRIIKNEFYRQVQELEDKGAGPDELRYLLGKGRPRKGMFEGDTEQGELEIGQASAMVNEIKPVKMIVQEIINEFETAKNQMVNMSL